MSEDDYVITADEREPGRWQGKVRRRDGQKIPKGEIFVEEIATVVANTSGEAMRLAREAIKTHDKISSKGWT